MDTTKNDMESRLKEMLLHVAVESKTVTYGEVAEALGLSMNSPAARSSLFRLLNAACEGESAAGRPMLGAVVVRADTRLPGAGFFKVACELGRLHPGEDEAAFHRAELERVWKSAAE